MQQKNKWSRFQKVIWNIKSSLIVLRLLLIVPFLLIPRLILVKEKMGKRLETNKTFMRWVELPVKPKENTVSSKWKITELSFYRKYFETVILYYPAAMIPNQSREMNSFFSEVGRISSEHSLNVVKADSPEDIEEIISRFNVDVNHALFHRSENLSVDLFNGSDGKLLERRWRMIGNGNRGWIRDGASFKDYVAEPDFSDDDPDCFFKWSEVLRCYGRVLNPVEFIGHLPCPRCGKPAQNLRWISYSSPPEYWQHLAGRAGRMSICEDCKLQVEFILSVMN